MLVRIEYSRKLGQEGNTDVALQLRADTMLVLRMPRLPIKRLWLKKINLWSDRDPRNKTMRQNCTRRRSRALCKILM